MAISGPSRRAISEVVQRVDGRGRLSGRTDRAVGLCPAHQPGVAQFRDVRLIQCYVHALALLGLELVAAGVDFRSGDDLREVRQFNSPVFGYGAEALSSALGLRHLEQVLQRKAHFRRFGFGVVVA